jgi:peptidoglycan/LPS O-acetylase OafA/YrhL
VTARISYRPEVDGLRAVAVLAVVLYHLDLPVPGGFVGVDCFFTISGFLIFSLLHQEVQAHGSVDWLAFFARRATRLLPEACALIVAVLIAGYFILLPIEADVGDVRSLPQRGLAESGAAASVWSANLYFAVIGIGYFHPGAWREPLVHLWSLGIEEQFYLAVPVMFVLTGALSRLTGRAWAAWAAALLGLVFVLSLAISAWWSTAHPWSAYYVLPTRAYEFVVGAAAALWLARRGDTTAQMRAAPAVAVFGIAAVAVSVVYFTREMDFPGFWALLPTVGTSLAIVACGPHASHGIRAVLTLPVLTYVGKVSYGWYLWHWPALVFWREYWMYDVSAWSEAAVVFAALVPAAIGYHMVARLRRASHETGRRPGRVIGYGMAGIAATLVACGALALASRFEASTPQGQALNARLKDRWKIPAECVEQVADAQGRLPVCAFGDVTGDVTVVLWGDSHALQWLPALDPLLKEMRLRGVLRAYAGCPSGLSGGAEVPVHFRRCLGFTAAATADVLERGREGPVAVMLSSRWAVYVNERPRSLVDRSARGGWAPGQAAIESSLEQLAARLRDEAIPVGIALPVPELRFEAPNCLYRESPDHCAEPGAAQREYLQPAAQLLRRVAARYDAALMDPAAALCPADSCPVLVGNKALYLDDDHLSGEGARHLRELLKELMVRLTDAARTADPATAGKP